jgi:hypothetical protein
MDLFPYRYQTVTGIPVPVRLRRNRTSYFLQGIPGTSNVKDMHILGMHWRLIWSAIRKPKSRISDIR